MKIWYFQKSDFMVIINKINTDKTPQNANFRYNNKKTNVMEIEKELQTNSIKIDFNLAFSIRKVRYRDGLKYQVVLKNNKNGNELPIKETNIPINLKQLTKRVITDYTYTTLKKMIDSEQERFDTLLEQFLQENRKNRTRKSKNT